jgi:hypothetical protein
MRCAGGISGAELRKRHHRTGLGPYPVTHADAGVGPDLCEKREYVEAAKRSTPATVIILKLFCRMRCALIVEITLGVGACIRRLRISFIGLAYNPDTRVGRMISESARVMREHPTLALYPVSVCCSACLPATCLETGCATHGPRLKIEVVL